MAPRPTSPTRPLAQLQALLDAFVDEYNHRRPHRSLPHRATPAARYTTMPKALPANSRDLDTHDRIRHDKVDKTGSVTLRHGGRLHHIGVGRTHTATRVILLIQDLHIRIVNAITGELLRDLILNPNTRLPTHRSTQRTHPKMTTAEPPNAGPAVADVLRHHRAPPARFERAANCLEGSCSIH